MHETGKKSRVTPGRTGEEREQPVQLMAAICHTAFSKPQLSSSARGTDSPAKVMQLLEYPPPDTGRVFAQAKMIKASRAWGWEGMATAVDKHTFTPAYSASHLFPACDFMGC